MWIEMKYNLKGSVHSYETADGWRVKIVWSDGEEDQFEGVFPTEDEARQAFVRWGSRQKRAVGGHVD
jgi:hypothetical protein